MSDNFTAKDASATTITLAASEDAGGVKASKQVSFTVTSQTSMTRTADTNVYAANDAITTAVSSPAAYTFTNVARISGGHATIVDAQLICSDVNSALPSFDLWLFDAAVTIPNDNAAFAFTDGEADICVAVLHFNASDYSDSSNNRIYHMANPPRQVKCAGATSLYGVLKTLTAFTPTSASTFNVKLKLLQDI